MSHQEYLRILEREIQNVNKVIDHKILRGQDYTKEARDHKLLMRHVRYHTQKNFFSRLALSFR